MSRSCKTEEVEHWATITQRGRVGTESHGDLLLHVQPAADEFAGRPRAHTQASGRHTRSSRTCGRETDPFVPPHDLPVRCENPLCRRFASFECVGQTLGYVPEVAQQTRWQQVARVVADRHEILSRLYPFA